MTRHWEEQYLNLIDHIYHEGDDRTDRTGVGTRAVFGKQLDINVGIGIFPLTTTKKTAFKAVKSELLWFLEGSTDERRLAEIHHGSRDADKTTIWTANAQADYWKPKAKFDGDLGNVYGKQWRSWTSHDGQTVDQLQQAIDKIKSNPTDRRMLVSAWNVGDLNMMALPPCHMFYQFFVAGDRVSLQMYQRSVDSMLGLPFNIASYAMLLEMVAQVTGKKADRLIMCLGDTHIYKHHHHAVPVQLRRTPLAPPKLGLNPDVKHIDDFKMDDIQLIDYESHDAIKLDMAV